MAVFGDRRREILATESRAVPSTLIFGARRPEKNTPVGIPPPPPVMDGSLRLA